MINKCRIINLFIVLFFVSLSLRSAYPSEEDSLKACLQSVKTNLERIKIINVLCEKTWLQANYSEALNYVERAFELEKTELLKSPSNRDVLIEQAYTFNNIAIIYRYKGDYSVSLDNHLKALKIREKINDVRGLARSNLGIGSIYDFLGKKKLALDYKFKAKKLFETAGDTTYLAFTCNHIGKIYFDLGNIPEAEKYNMQALQLFIKKGNGTGMMDAFSLAGQIYYTKGEYTDAIHNFESGLSWSRGFGLKDREISSLLDISRVYTKKKEFKEAKKHLNAAMKLAGETGAKVHLSEVYRGLCIIDSAENNYKEAFKYYKLHIIYRDSLSNQETTEKVSKLQAEFENEKVAKIRALEEEKKESERKEKEYKQKLVLYSISGGLLIMFVFSIFIFRSYRAKQKVNKELLVKNEIIAEQKHVVEEKQKEIIDSIRYAKRIQMSLLASEKYIQKSIEKLKQK